MEIVIGFDFAAEARNYALLQSLYVKVNIFLVLQKYSSIDLCASKFPARR